MKRKTIHHEKVKISVCVCVCLGLLFTVSSNNPGLWGKLVEMFSNKQFCTVQPVITPT
jgi:hypothetical protein